VTWSRAFDDPILLPDGRSIETLRGAGNYIMALGKARERPEWQAAAEAVLMAAEGRRDDPARSYWHAESFECG
jgi:hypothetical protein